MMLMQISSTVRRFPSASPSLLCLLAVIICCTPSRAQQKTETNSTTTQQTTVAQPKLTRTTTRHEVRRMPYGSTVTLLGAPVGSITIEAWSRPEIDITADIELRADTEEDLTRLAVVNSFVIDDEPNHLRILTTGMHDKKFMRRAAKDFPKKLLGLPWKIDYRLRVPVLTDLEINNGSGAFNLAGVEGNISFQAQESDAALLRGSVKLTIGARSWRGAGANVQLAAGNITLELPSGFSGDVDADILRTGTIENNNAELTPRERTTPTPRSTKSRAGAGGTTVALTVGDGTIKLTKTEVSSQQ
jgi:hypothetical protein